MVNYYSAMLNLSGKKAVVIGGGAVAARKILTLLEADAEVTVISPELHESIREVFLAKKIIWKQKRFEPDDLQDFFLIIAATNQSAINVQVYESANSQQLINLVDRPDLSNFIVPASLRRGALTISVSTSGASPGLARKIKQDLAKEYDEVYEEYLLFLEQSRKRVIEEVADSTIRRQMLQGLLEPQFLELTRQANYKEREARLLQLLTGGIAP
ncbi:siroheme synthase [Peribacillus asahii]|uniref:precorrin-2 dehydrogenase n=1 Tax=Peribacillus asahii TaxID=228899 RepID=A0A398BCV7_9BACI|nr:NAD(P)-dependent oxidoreductase [Peribacillus asahii]RID87434.1 siroheme synthase [Peribacillus asahii]